MKPKLGQKVYCIMYDDILADKVGYLGKESFIIDDFSEFNKFESFEWFYNDYGFKWFTKLKDAKESILKDCEPEDRKRFKFVRNSYGDYTLEEK